MIRQARADCVIVTTVDRFHHEYIIRSLDAGCDAITEKPMTVNDANVRAILAAERRAGRKTTVTFNYRFNPYVTRVKELLVEGAIGDVLSVDFEWILDTRHGADYFRRWHRKKENSGGLLVHKATHHFDMINWWLGAEPETVYAAGARRFYGPTRAERAERCCTCPHRHTCEFYVDYASDPLLKALYFDAEHVDGYYRDRCPGLSGDDEQLTFQTLPPAPAPLVEKICRLLVIKLLPALVEDNIVQFGQALTQIQQLVGDSFAAVQGGQYANTLSGQVIAHMLERGAQGAGQSSWGATVYALTQGEGQARLLETVIQEFLEPHGGGEVFHTRADNYGARLKTTIG